MSAANQRLAQAGDTIVEVLISLALLTFVLAGAYYTANLSYKNVRDSQEHVEATNIAETQAEDLRILGNPASWNASDACVYNSNGALTAEPSSSNDCSEPIDGSSSNFDINVTQSSQSFSTSLGVVNFYTYKINVTWQELGGGNSDVTLYYRVDG